MSSSLRKYKTPLPSFPKYLPVTEIPDTPKYCGIFIGEVVKVKSSDDTQELQECGCFGVSSRFQKQFVNERYYEVCEGIDSDVAQSQANIIGKTELDEDLTLFLEEAFFLHHSLKVLQLIDATGQNLSTDQFLQECLRLKPNFIPHFVAYQYFRAKNWVVKQGTNFGSDFLLYKMGPQYYHSQYTVKVRNSMDSSDKFPSKQFMGWYRISETSKKECLVIDVVPPNNETDDPMEFIRKLSQFKVEILTFKRFNLWKGSKSVAGASSTE